jgi:hypothetical protein
VALAVFWLVELLRGENVGPALLCVCIGAALLLVLYLKNKTMRLGKTGIQQGYWIFQSFVSYDRLKEVRKETRMLKGSAAPVLAVYGRDTRRTMVIPVRSFVRTELSDFVKLLKLRSPEAEIPVDLNL